MPATKRSKKQYAWAEGARLSIDVVSVDVAPKKPVRKVPSEALECARLVDYLKSRGLLFTHVANETKSKTQRIRNARLGTSSGFPDYAVFFPMGRALFIEMKRVKGGRLSAEQREWIDALQARGHDAIVCAGFADARAEIDARLQSDARSLLEHTELEK